MKIYMVSLLHRATIKQHENIYGLPYYIGQTINNYNVYIYHFSSQAALQNVKHKYTFIFM